jgi:hypothetical protein
VGMTVPHSVARARVVAAGVAVDNTMPATYTPSPAKNAKDCDTYPCVVLRPNGSVGLQTMSFGARRFGCHCVFDGWMDKPSWKAAATAPAGRCAVVCTSFIEGITARRADDGIFFVLALKIGESEFVILTTDAKRTVLLGERAAKSEGFG